MPEEIKYQCSDTQLTASWEKQFDYYRCTNCHHTESHGYPARSIQLGRFCPNCGFKMTNPQWVHIEVEFEDFY